MPSAMIQKVAEVFTLRRQFPLGGIVTAEEMGTEEAELSGDLGANPFETDQLTNQIEEDNVPDKKSETPIPQSNLKVDSLQPVKEKIDEKQNLDQSHEKEEEQQKQQNGTEVIDIF